jgi:hypothetical protein
VCVFQAKIHYLDIISGLPSYGAKCFSTNQRDGVERVLLISPRFGLSQIAGIRNSVVSIIAARPVDFSVLWKLWKIKFNVEPLLIRFSHVLGCIVRRL